MSVASRTVLDQGVKRELNGYPCVKDDNFTTRSQDRKTVVGIKKG